MDDFRYYGFGYYGCRPLPNIYPWPDIKDLLLRDAEHIRVMVIAPVSVCLTRAASRPISTGHESRRRHRGLGGRNFR